MGFVYDRIADRSHWVVLNAETRSSWHRSELEPRYGISLFVSKRSRRCKLTRGKSRSDIACCKIVCCAGRGTRHLKPQTARGSDRPFLPCDLWLCSRRWERRKMVIIGGRS
jgi:hypothetical protein